MEEVNARMNEARISSTVTQQKGSASKNWIRSAPKIKALAFFSRHLQTSRKRDALLRFMERMKMQYERDKDELDNSVEDFASRIQTRRPRSPPVVENPVPNPDGPSWKSYEVAPDKPCSLCECPELPVVMCRVCSDVFHERCLLRCDDLHPSDVINIGKAASNIGWSCPDCANIALLLDEAEVKEMADKFGLCDFNQDAKITVDEFVTYQDRQCQRNEGRGLSIEDRNRVLREFRLMDQNGDGVLDWWEFLNHESKMYLAKRKPRELVDLLTDKELVAAKATFKVLDIDGDGGIKEYEALQSYKHWYRQFEKQRSSRDVIADTSILDFHAAHAARFLMTADTHGRGVVQWEDFILEQALYIICSRPNYKVG